MECKHHAFGLSMVQPVIAKDISGISQSTGIYQGYPCYMLKHENLSTGIRFQMQGVCSLSAPSCQWST